MNMFLWIPILVTSIGMVLDFVFGEPKLICHPVILIGRLITIIEKITRRIFPKTKTGERIAGVVFGICIIGISTGASLLVVYLAYRINIWVGIALDAFFCFRLLANKSLKTESMRVYHKLVVADELNEEQLKEARYALSMIVGRDTQELDTVGITKAVVETIAENTSDGITAPQVYMMIAGAVGGFFYKSVNTMDSMVGYKNDRYQYFGTFAAKMDDVLNYIPARFSAVMMVLASGFCGFSAKNAWRIHRRDRYKHASPNSAQTESVMAGALGVQLAGPASYFGKIHEKQYIGDPDRKIVPEDIVAANRIMYVTNILSLIVLALIRWGIFYGVFALMK